VCVVGQKQQDLLLFSIPHLFFASHIYFSHLTIIFRITEIIVIFANAVVFAFPPQAISTNSTEAAPFTETKRNVNFFPTEYPVKALVPVVG
jgi:hypothetical protein